MSENSDDSLETRLREFQDIDAYDPSSDTSKEKNDETLPVIGKQIHELSIVGTKNHKLVARVKKVIDEAARQISDAKEQAARERNTVTEIRKATQDCIETENHLKEVRIERITAEKKLKEVMEELKRTMH